MIETVREELPPATRWRQKLKQEIRTVTKGGMVIDMGYRHTEHCYLDFLLNERLLGNEPEASYRYDTGYRLRELYFSFNPSGRSTLEPSESTNRQFVTEENVEEKKAEDYFHDVMRTIPKQYRREVRFVCLEDLPPVKGVEAFHRQVILGLDDLHQAFDVIDKIRT